MLKGYRPSKHLINDREERVFLLGKYIGFGQELLAVKDSSHGRDAIITTTGLILICEPGTKNVVTMFAPDSMKIIALYKSVGKNCPSWLIEQTKKNTKKCRKLGIL